MSRIVFQHANLVPGDGPALPNRSVVVEGERIAEILEGHGHANRPDDRVIDLEGRTLMPGMWSSHFHSVFENVAPDSGPALGIQHPPAYLALVAGKNAGIALDCGVTSVIGSRNQMT